LERVAGVAGKNEVRRPRFLVFGAIDRDLRSATSRWVDWCMIGRMSNIETKTVNTAILTVSVKYKNEFLPDCSVRFYGNGRALGDDKVLDSGKISLSTDAFPIALNVPIVNFRVQLDRPYTVPGDKPVLGIVIRLEDFVAPRELVFVIVDGPSSTGEAAG